MGLRDEVLRGLEDLRQEKKIASNQESSVAVYCGDEELVGILGEFGLEQFAALCIVSEVTLQKDADKTTVAAQKSNYKKCQRCWNLWPSVGADSKHPDLCKRCIETVSR
jgi:isoleucyl-tRNA synthetase